MVKRKIINTRDGYHFNSKHWQEYKKQLPPLPLPLFETCVGMVLGDGSLFKDSQESGIKFEQGYKQKEFLYHLFDLLSKYTFMETPGLRIDLHPPRKGLIKSYWFKTFSYPCFSKLHSLFCANEKRKALLEGLITDWLTPRGLAYWIMCDGSLQKDRLTLIVHTQSFTRDENLIAANELNNKWGLHCRVISHKQRYWVLQTDPKDAATLRSLISPFLIPSMQYKCPSSLSTTTL